MVQRGSIGAAAPATDERMAAHGATIFLKVLVAACPHRFRHRVASVTGVAAGCCGARHGLPRPCMTLVWHGRSQSVRCRTDAAAARAHRGPYREPPGLRPAFRPDRRKSAPWGRGSQRHRLSTLWQRHPAGEEAVERPSAESVRTVRALSLFVLHLLVGGPPARSGADVDIAFGAPLGANRATVDSPLVARYGAVHVLSVKFHASRQLDLPH